MEQNLEKLKDLYGELLTVITPSGHQVTLRMQNGNDDDVLSNAEGVLDGTSSNRFIAGIIVDTDITPNRKFNLDTARDLKLCDKYFIMIASRIFSIGQILKFSYPWSDLKEPTDYEEDLGVYIWEYGNENKPFPKPGDEDYYKYRIKPHAAGKESMRESITRSGKVYRYKYMNGHGEKYLMNLPPERQSVNAELLARGLEIKMGEGFVLVQNFSNFSAMDMMDIRKDVSDHDESISLVSELKHPKTGEIIEYPIIGTSDFFYPRET